MRNHLGQADEGGNESRLKAVVCEIMKDKERLRFEKTQCLEEAGMKVSMTRSSVIESSETSGVEKFPLIVARRIRESDGKTTPEEILSLATFRDLSTMSINLKEDMADLFLRSLGEQQIMFEAVAEYVDRSGIRTIRKPRGSSRGR
jgi:hypothetical protein